MKYATIAFFVLLNLFAQAQIKTWDGGAGTNNWEDANNWDPNGVPTIINDVEIDNDSVSINANQTVKSILLESTHATETNQAVFLQNGVTLSIFNSLGDGLYLFKSARFWNAGNLIISNAANNGLRIVTGTFENMANQGFVAISLCDDGVYNQGTFQNRNNAEVIIKDNSNNGFYNQGSMSQCSNRGGITISDVENGFNNKGTFLNRGNLAIYNTSDSGIKSNKHFENLSSGVISLDTLSKDGISASLEFINKGIINIKEAEENGIEDYIDSLNFVNYGFLNISKSGQDGIVMNQSGGILNNQSGGEILIDSTTESGIYTKGNLINNGEIDIHQTILDGIAFNGDSLINNGLINIESSLTYGIFQGGEYFINTVLGEINIDSKGTTGMFVFKKFLNEGELTILNTSESGLINSSSNTDSLVNNGLININTSSKYGLYHRGSVFINSALGVINIDSVGFSGVNIGNRFINDGSLSITRSVSTNALYNTPFNTDSLINNGQISIQNSIQNNINNSSTFLNNSCAKISVDGSILNSATFKNKGLIINDSNDPITFISGGFFENEGTFINPTLAQPISADFINDGNLIIPIMGLLSEGVKEFNVFSGSSTLHSIAGTWWEDEAKTVTVGTFDIIDKSFSPNATGVLADSLWLEINNASCTMMVNIPINKVISCGNQSTATFTGAVSSDWHSPENWDTGLVPDPCSIVIIPAAKNCTITTGRKARAYRIEAETGSVFDAELGVVLDVNPE